MVILTTKKQVEKYFTEFVANPDLMVVMNKQTLKETKETLRRLLKGIGQEHGSNLMVGRTHRIPVFVHPHVQNGYMAKISKKAFKLANPLGALGKPLELDGLIKPITHEKA